MYVTLVASVRFNKGWQAELSRILKYLTIPSRELLKMPSISWNSAEKRSHEIRLSKALLHSELP